MKYAFSILIAAMALLSLSSCDPHSRHHRSPHAKHIAVHKPLKAHVPIPKKRKTIEIKPYHDNVYIRQNGNQWDYIELISDVIEKLADAHESVKIAKIETTYFAPNPSQYNNLGESAKGIRFVLSKENREELEEGEGVYARGVIEAEDEEAEAEAEAENEAIDAENATAEAENAAADAEAAAADAADAASDAAADAADAAGSGDGAGAGDGGGDSGGGDGGGGD